MPCAAELEIDGNLQSISCRTEAVCVKNCKIASAKGRSVAWWNTVNRTGRLIACPSKTQKFGQHEITSFSVLTTWFYLRRRVCGVDREGRTKIRWKNGPDWARTSDPALIKRML